MYYNFSRKIDHKLKPENHTIAANVKVQIGPESMIPGGVGPNIFLFDRIHLCYQNGVGKIFYLFLLYKYHNVCRFFYILRQKNNKNQNIFSIKNRYQIFPTPFSSQSCVLSNKNIFEPIPLGNH